MLIDTHAHLYLAQFDDDREEMVQRAIDSGVKKIFLPNIDSTTIDAMLDLEEKFPGKCYAMMGLHPCSVNENYKEELLLVEEWLGKRDFIGVGEIGTDLYWDKTFKDAQEQAFRIQLQLAAEHKKPVAIHSRETLDWNISIVSEVQDGRLSGIFHCFNGTAEQAARIDNMGMHIGLGGVITYKNAGLDEMLSDVSLDNVVLETDAPYLTPVPFRGKRNESEYVSYVCAKLASARHITPAEVADITTANALSLYGL